MIETLNRMLSELELSDIKPAIYLSLGSFGPDYDKLVLGIKDKFLLTALSKLTGIPGSEIKSLYEKYGDVGDLAENLSTKIGVQTRVDDFFSDETVNRELSLSKVYESFSKLAKEGLSNNAKIEIIGDIDSNLSALEKKYYYRALVGKLRLGVKESTWIAALAKYNDEGDKEEIEYAYHMTSDIALVAETAISNGMEGVRALCHVHVGTPVHSMVAHRISSGEELRKWIKGEFAIENKYDGYRIQIHRTSHGVVTLWSRNQESYTNQFPDILEVVGKIFNESVVLDGEVVAYDYERDKVQNFNILTQRSRKYGIEETVKQVPVRVFLFDILHIDGKDMIKYPYLTRREVLKKVIPENDIMVVSDIFRSSDPEDADLHLLTAKETNQEGIMIKDLSEEAIYEPGKRSFFWLKYKADYSTNLLDTFDLVIMGAKHGKGKRAGVFGTFLMGIYNTVQDTYHTFCYLGSGFSEKDLEELTAELNDIRVEEKPADYDSLVVPDAWFIPHIILEVSAAEISDSPVHTVRDSDGKAYALRFPRYTGKRRTDKSVPDGVTTLEEVVEISKHFRIGSN